MSSCVSTTQSTAEASTRQHARVRVRRAHERGVQHPGPLDLDRVAQIGGHAGVHATSSTARRTSAAITRRRYLAEPRESDSGSIRSAYLRADLGRLAGTQVGEVLRRLGHRADHHAQPAARR